MLLLVRGQSPFQNMAQYMAAAKTRPIRYGSSGIGSANHLYGELLKLEGPAPEHDHVPYQGSAPAMQDLLGGQIDSLFDPITTNIATVLYATANQRDGRRLLDAHGALVRPPHRTANHKRAKNATKR